MMFEIYQVYDNRTGKTLFTSRYQSDCIRFIHENYDEIHADWDHVFIKSIFENETEG